MHMYIHLLCMYTFMYNDQTFFNWQKQDYLCLRMPEHHFYLLCYLFDISFW